MGQMDDCDPPYRTDAMGNEINGPRPRHRPQVGGPVNLDHLRSIGDRLLAGYDVDGHHVLAAADEIEAARKVEMARKKAR